MICLNDQLQDSFNTFETSIDEEQKLLDAANARYSIKAQSYLEALQHDFEHTLGIKSGDRITINFRRLDNVIFQFSAYYVGLTLNKGEAILNLNKIKKNGEMMIQRDPRYVRVNDIISVS